MRFSRFLLTFAFSLSFAAAASAAGMRDIETRGTLKDISSGQIAGNVWSGLSRSEALLLIDSLPDKYASPIYFELARRLLLSDAPSLGADAPKKAPVDAKGNPLPVPDPNKPSVLIARLDKLLAMGAIRDAENLYNAVVPDNADDFDLVLRSLEILMLRGQLSAACLDLQAIQPQHSGNPKWQEINRLCRIQFTAAGAERERLLNEKKFTEFPQLNGYLRGKGPGGYRSMSVQDTAFAVATKQINEGTLRYLMPQAGNIPPLLLSVLYNMETDGDIPEKSCLAIESARRGIITTRELITVYEKPHYDSALLLQNLGTNPSGQIHPCMVPSVMYQRIASNMEKPTRDQTMRTGMDVMNDLPDAAFWPMATYFQEMDVHDSVNKPYLWRLTRITAYEKDELPAGWSQWEEQNGQPGVAPFWPVQAIMQPDGHVSAKMELWKTQWPDQARKILGRDPSLPVLLGLAMTPEGVKTGQKQKNGLEDYENILPLTFSRSYSIPSYGLTQRLSDVIKNNQTGQSVALLLIGYGAIPPDQVIPTQMALVIDGLNRAGLGRYARRFGLEVLR